MAEYPTIATPPAGYLPPPQNGAIGGGALRPGAIDQSQFQKLLQAQYQAQTQGKAPASPTGMTLSDYRKLAGMPVAASVALPASPTPVAPTDASSPPTQTVSSGDGIPTLSLEQFAALTGLSVPDSPAPSPQQPSALPESSVPGQIVRLETSPVETADTGEMDLPLDEEAAPALAPETAPPEMADGVPVAAEAVEPAATASPTNSRVVLLDSPPDREEQRRLGAQGKTWRMKETPGARELFLGPDGKFGWDDFVDIINPLQHIPVVAQIYRAVTGDQAYGLSAFVGAIPFGPLSVASAVVDTMVRSQTGRDAGTDLAAAVLGIDNRTPEEADLRLVTDSADQAALANASPSAPATQVADASPPPSSPTSWTRESAGVGHD